VSEAVKQVLGVLMFLFLVGMAACGDDEETPEEFLRRVEAAMSPDGRIAHVTGRTRVLGQQVRPLWSTDAWYDVPNQAGRILHTKAPTASLDIPDERLELRVEGNVYDPKLGERNAPVSRFSTDQRPNCFPGEPQTVVLKLLCADVFNDGSGRLKVEGVIDFEGRQVRSLALVGPNTMTRLLVDPDSYMPVAQTLTSQTPGNEEVIRSEYVVELTDRITLPPDFFDPRSLSSMGP
jgi:hypothetical protein